MLFWIWLRPRYKIPEFFTIPLVFTSTLTVRRRNRSDPSSIGLRVRYKKVLQKIVVLVWPGAAHVPIAQCPSVRLYVRLLRWCIASRRLKMSSNFFFDQVYSIQQ